MEEKITTVAWDQIRISPFQPRRHFSEEELSELALTIREVGLIHPPVVRAIRNGDKILYYELIAGERRWRAAKSAGLKKLNVILRESTEEEAARATLIENVQRVNLDPIELAQAYKRLIDVFQMTQEEVADRVGKKRSTVANYLRLLSLPEYIRLTLSQGTITMGHAKAILSLTGPELQQALHRRIVEKNLTVRETETESHKLTPKKKVAPHLQDLIEQLQHHFATKVEIHPSSGKKGRLTLHYYSDEDLERLLEICNLKIESTD